MLGFNRSLPPLNSEGLVVPVLFRAKDIDICVDTSFRHGWEAQAQDLVGHGVSNLIIITIITVFNGDGVIRSWIWKKRRGVQDRRVRNRRKPDYSCAH